MARPIRVLELRSVRGTGGGPEKTILQGAARTDPSRFHIVVCYLRDSRDAIFSIGERAGELGVHYVEIHERHSFDRAIWPALRNVVREQAIDIVHAHDYKTNLLAYVLTRRSGVVALSTVHGWTGHSFRERWLYYPADRQVLARFPQLIAVSSEIKSTLVSRGAAPERVTVVLNGIDHLVHRRQPEHRQEARRALGLAESDFVVGSVGRVEPQKRYDLLVEAIARLLPAHPGIKLVIAGDGSRLEEVRSLAATRLPTGTWKLLGNRSDVIFLHHTFDCYVQSSDYEGTSNSVLEAMALETPLVATDVGGTRELAAGGVHALIVPPSNIHELTAAIADVRANPESARRRARAARARVENELSFDRRMQRIESIYERMVARP